MKINVVVAKLHNGRILVLGDTGQDDMENLYEMQELVENIRASKRKNILADITSVEIDI